MSDIPRILTIRQTAKTGIASENTLRAWLRQGRLPGYYTGKHYRVNVDMLIEQINRESGANSSNFFEQ